MVLAALVTIGIALGFVSQNFYPGLIGVNISPETGTLVVRAISGSDSGGTPIAGASVLIDAGVSGEKSELLQTNSSGEVRVQLEAGTHSLVVYNDHFSITDNSVPVQSKGTTTASVYVRAYLVRPVFTQLPDPDDTGYANIWDPITIAVNASSVDVLLTNANVFFNVAYAPGTSTAGGTTAIALSSSSSSTSSSSSQAGPSSSTPGEVRAILFSQPIGPSDGSTTGLWWTSWEPSVPLLLTGLSSLSLVTYTASIEVLPT